MSGAKALTPDDGNLRSSRQVPAGITQTRLLSMKALQSIPVSEDSPAVFGQNALARASHLHACTSPRLLANVEPKAAGSRSTGERIQLQPWKDAGFGNFPFLAFKHQTSFPIVTCDRRTGARLGSSGGPRTLCLPSLEQSVTVVLRVQSLSPSFRFSAFRQPTVPNCMVGCQFLYCFRRSDGAIACTVACCRVAHNCIKSAEA